MFESISLEAEENPDRSEKTRRTDSYDLKEKRRTKEARKTNKRSGIRKTKQ